MLVILYHLNLVYKATSTTYALRGGNSGVGLNCGLFYVRLSLAASYTGWGVGAALSFKL